MCTRLRDVALASHSPLRFLSAAFACSRMPECRSPRKLFPVAGHEVRVDELDVFDRRPFRAHSHAIPFNNVRKWAAMLPAPARAGVGHGLPRAVLHTREALHDHRLLARCPFREKCPRGNTKPLGGEGMTGSGPTCRGCSASTRRPWTSGDVMAACGSGVLRALTSSPRANAKAA